MKLSKKTKILGVLNIVYLSVIAIEESKVIELLPFEETMRHSIKAITLVVVGILNVVIAQLKIK
jgi:uncharacterized membrane protein YiaA